MTKKDDFQEYIKVKNVNMESVDGEPYLIRLRMDDETFAHIEIKPMGSNFNLTVLQITETNERKLVKWVSGLTPNQ